MQLYAITDRRLLAGPDELFRLVQEWAEGGVQCIQLREKDLSPAQLASLATEIRARTDLKQGSLLLNISSPELAAVALAAGADGVHLAGKPRPGAVAAARRAAGRPALVSLPCHNHLDVALAREEGADLILFSPVFEKGSQTPQGLEALSLACTIAGQTPILALGGVTAENAARCQAAGAAGVAGIRLFADGDWRQLTASKHI